MFRVSSIDMQSMLRNERGRVRVVGETLNPSRRRLALERIGKFEEIEELPRRLVNKESFVHFRPSIIVLLDSVQD